ncbi:hypothetical protein JKF63_05408 [Porcisia hertigi]|uniref:Kinesin motor domain-containing protein n=1 Tax=Porcisia hertigi TaxID=2761500 RepID=A0A836IA20_9TRYP|nr:hypothetical protein JKF63_05408 [Porcisia hertigi]
MLSSAAERIHVYGRVRPPASHDTPLWITIDGGSSTLQCGEMEEVLPPKAGATPLTSTPRRELVAESSTFTLDGVVGDICTSATNDFLEGTARSCVVDSLLKGTSVTIVCCGAAGTGKSTTMFGDAAVNGLCQRTLASLFAELAGQSEPSTSGSHSPVVTAAFPMLKKSSPCGSRALEQEEGEEPQGGSRRRHTVQLSFLALHGEKLVDLLAEDASGAPPNRTFSSTRLTLPPPPLASSSSSSSSATPTITMDIRGKVMLSNVSKVICRSAEDALALISRGRRTQSSAASRTVPGHAIVVVDVTSEEGLAGSADHHALLRAQLHLVDLAAVESLTSPPYVPRPPPPARPSSVFPSKRSADTDSLPQDGRAESAAIRRSLAALQEVLTRLSSMTAGAASQKSSLYKQSRLTMLLKGHLGGGCRTLVIAHVRSEEAYKKETLSTLQLARRFLCVPEQPVSRVTEDPLTQVSKLRQQVSALQMGLRLQMELSALAASTASASTAAIGSGDRATSANGKGVKRRGGDASPKATQQLLLSTPTEGSCDQACSPSKTPGEAVGDCHSRLLCAASSSAAPVAAVLAGRVMDFVAGRIATLPVSTVLEMNTCFELLRQCVVERDIQLAAALADLQSAEAATAAVLAATEGNHSHSTALERFSGRSTAAYRAASGGGTRRRSLSLTKLNGSSATDTPAPEGGQCPSAYAVPLAATTQLLKLNPSHTTLLREPSPSILVPGVSNTGKGYGTAPSAAGSSRDVLKPRALCSSTPRKSDFPQTWLNAVSSTTSTATNAPPDLATEAQRLSRGVETAGKGVVFSSARDEMSPLSHHSAPESRSHSLPVAKDTKKSLRQVFTTEQSSTQRDQAQTDLRAGGPTSTKVVHSATHMPPPPHLDTPPPSAAFVPLESGHESSVYHLYTTTTDEGIQQVQRIRRVEEALDSLRIRLAWNTMDSSKQNDISLKNECRHLEGQLACLREDLLRRLESWYEAGSAAENSAITRTDRAASHLPRNPSGNWKQRTLDTMRRRLRRPISIGGTESADDGSVADRLGGGTINYMRADGFHKSQSSCESVSHLGSGFALLNRTMSNETGLLNM